MGSLPDAHDHDAPVRQGNDPEHYARDGSAGTADRHEDDRAGDRAQHPERGQGQAESQRAARVYGFIAGAHGNRQPPSIRYINAVPAQTGSNQWTRPTVYLRWRSKAHLVREAVFPDMTAEELPVPANATFAEDVLLDAITGSVLFMLLIRPADAHRFAGALTDLLLHGLLAP